MVCGRIFSFKGAPFSRTFAAIQLRVKAVRVKRARVQTKGEAKKDGPPLTVRSAYVSGTGVRAPRSEQ